MRVAFHSNHVNGDFGSGKLVVQVTNEDARRRITRTRETFFNVPSDFHAHHDLVAAALMALMRCGFTSARFNFPISAQCAATLPRYYQLNDVGPVDPDLGPRRPAPKGLPYDSSRPARPFRLA